MSGPVHVTHSPLNIHANANDDGVVACPRSSWPIIPITKRKYQITCARFVQLKFI